MTNQNVINQLELIKKNLNNKVKQNAIGATKEIPLAVAIANVIGTDKDLETLLKAELKLKAADPLAPEVLNVVKTLKPVKFGGLITHKQTVKDFEDGLQTEINKLIAALQAAENAKIAELQAAENAKIKIAELQAAENAKIKIAELQVAEPTVQVQAQKEAAKAALQAMVDAYNAAIVGQNPEGASLTKEEKQAKFIQELQAKLTLNSEDLPKDFEKKAKDCFTDLRRVHQNQAANIDLKVDDQSKSENTNLQVDDQSKSENTNLQVDGINQRTWTQAIRDFLVLILTGIFRSPAYFGIIDETRVDSMITKSSSEQSVINHATRFQNLVEKQQAATESVKQQI